MDKTLYVRHNKHRGEPMKVIGIIEIVAGIIIGIIAKMYGFSLLHAAIIPIIFIALGFNNIFFKGPKTKKEVR